MRFLLLNSTMIPISLKVTLVLCKPFYAKFILLVPLVLCGSADDVHWRVGCNGTYRPEPFVCVRVKMGFEDVRQGAEAVCNGEQHRHQRGPRPNRVHSDR